MIEVGIRALKQNASAVIANAAAGEVTIVTDRGRAVAQITPLSASPVQRLTAAGRLRPAKRDIADLPEPSDAEVSLSAELDRMRDAERY